jgi:cathepsin L
MAVRVLSKVVAACSIAAPVVAEQAITFQEFLQQFDKAYEGAEWFTRKALFDQRVEEMQNHNSNPEALWSKGINEFSDMTEAELRRYRGYNKRMRSIGTSSGAQLRTSKTELPQTVDWRTHSPNVVTTVKNQGGCGSCWAFATSEVLESHIALQTGTLLSLAPQQLVDCMPNPQECGGTGGCSGATIELGLNFTAFNGITDVWHYPYSSGLDGKETTCRASKAPLAGVKGFERVPANDAQALMEAVATKGPIGISVDASNFNAYHGGVHDSCNKTHPDIDHAVVLMGYGEEKGAKYWLVRNSWGPLWGENGYIRIRRYDDEACAMDITPDHGSACKGETEPVKVCGECGILSDSAYAVGGFIHRPGSSIMQSQVIV